MRDIKSNIKIVDHLPAAQRAAGNYEGTAVDCQGFESLLMHVSAGAFGTSATLDVKLQHSDDNVTFEDITNGAITQMTAAGRAILQIDQLTKRYVKAVAVAGTASVDFGVTLMLGGARELPVTQD